MLADCLINQGVNDIGFILQGRHEEGIGSEQGDEEAGGIRAPEHGLLSCRSIGVR